MSEEPGEEEASLFRGEAESRPQQAGARRPAAIVSPETPATSAA